MAGKAIGLTRRALLMAASAGGAGLASAALLPAPVASEEANETMELIKQIVGHVPTVSDRVHLKMPASFPTGYTVPLEIEIDSPMTSADHVRLVRVFAPRNPITEVVTFSFTAGRSEARASTRVRLAAPQFVVAVAEMNDGTFLMNKTWVEVATNGCA